MHIRQHGDCAKTARADKLTQKLVTNIAAPNFVAPCATPYPQAMFGVALPQGSTGSFTDGFAGLVFRQNDQVNADVRGGTGSCCDHECEGFA